MFWPVTTPSDKELSALASPPGTVTKDGFNLILGFNFIGQLDWTWSNLTISTGVVGLEKTYMEYIVHRQRCGKLQAVCLASNAFKDGVWTNKAWLELATARQIQVLRTQHDLIANLKLHRCVLCIIIACLGLLCLAKCSLCIGHKLFSVGDQILS